MPRCTMSVPVSKPMRRYFAAPVDPAHEAAANARLSIFASIGQRKRRSRTRNADDASADDGGSNAPPGGFYFG